MRVPPDALIGLVPWSPARQRNDLPQLGARIDECWTELWLPTDAEAGRLQRVSAVHRHLAEPFSLPWRSVVSHAAAGGLRRLGATQTQLAR
jgi:hypothetical protein